MKKLLAIVLFFMFAQSASAQEPWREASCVGVSISVNELTTYTRFVWDGLVAQDTVDELTFWSADVVDNRYQWPVVYILPVATYRTSYGNADTASCGASCLIVPIAHDSSWAIDWIASRYQMERGR